MNMEIIIFAQLLAILLGLITTWNDQAILNDNANYPDVLQALNTITQPISVVVRLDGSGTSAIATGGFASFSPSFTGVIGASNEKPFWCESKTGMNHIIIHIVL